MEAMQVITGDMTINETITEWPETVGIFERFGFDTCCGGSLPIREASRRHDLELERVLGALNRNRDSGS